jgi:drug/metabolite transporter (DMT)-like permease
LRAFRCAAGLGGFCIGMLAILWLPFADAVAIMHARPLWALPLAFMILGERIGWGRAVAAAIGFAGVLIIVDPGAEVSAGTLMALMGGVTGAFVLIAIRLLSATAPPSRVVAIHALATVALYGPIVAFVWVTPSWQAAGLACARHGTCRAACIRHRICTPSENAPTRSAAWPRDARRWPDRDSRRFHGMVRGEGARPRA